MKPVLVIGASGYVGARLAPVELLDCRSAIRVAIPDRRSRLPETGESGEPRGQGEAKIIPGNPSWAGPAPA